MHVAIELTTLKKLYLTFGCIFITCRQQFNPLSWCYLWVFYCRYFKVM